MSAKNINYISYFFASQDDIKCHSRQKYEKGHRLIRRFDPCPPPWVRTRLSRKGGKQVCPPPAVAAIGPKVYKNIQSNSSSYIIRLKKRRYENKK